MTSAETHVCPAEKSGHLSSSLRSLFNNPKKLLGHLVSRGDTVVDLGCGPGFFTLPLAKMVGEDGRVIAVDIQEEMLVKLRTRSDKAGMSARIVAHLATPDHLGVSEVAAFALAFWVLHETPDQRAFLEETYRMLRPGSRLLLAEPRRHVPRDRFTEVVEMAQDVGYDLTRLPRVGLSHAALLTKPR